MLMLLQFTIFIYMLILTFCFLSSELDLFSHVLIFSGAIVLASQVLALALLLFVIRYILDSDLFIVNKSSNFNFITAYFCFVQCEKEFHVGCLRDHNIDDLKVF